MSAGRIKKGYMNLTSVIVFVPCLLLVAGNTVFAEPYLMLDADPSHYVYGDEESIVTDDPGFTLYALVNSEAPEWSDLAETFYISAAIVPSLDESPALDLGSYFLDYSDYSGTVVDSTIDVVAEMTYGTPPIEEHLKQNGLPSHGIYETYYYEYSFTLDPDNNAPLYNSMVTPGGPDLFVDGALYYQAFDVDVSELTSGYAIHFDLYTKGSPSIDKFAPFSHDVTTPVPASVILGMLGLGIAGLKLRKYA